jgi:hypothetical protein
MKRSLFALLLLLLSAKVGLACTCSTSSVEKATKQADQVFQGKIVKINYLDAAAKVPNRIFPERLEDVPRRFVATLEVSGVWKGKVGRTIVMHERETGPDCVGFWTEIGTEVVVFAGEWVVTPKKESEWRIPEWTDKVPVGNRMVSKIPCGLSSELAYASQTLKKLGKPKAPSK